VSKKTGSTSYIAIYWIIQDYLRESLWQITGFYEVLPKIGSNSINCAAALETFSTPGSWEGLGENQNSLGTAAQRLHKEG
jgi:hypothetical protein